MQVVFRIYIYICIYSYIPLHVVYIHIYVHTRTRKWCSGTAPSLCIWLCLYIYPHNIYIYIYIFTYTLIHTGASGVQARRPLPVPRQSRCTPDLGGKSRGKKTSLHSMKKSPIFDENPLKRALYSIKRTL